MEHICQTLRWVLLTLFETSLAQSLSKNHGDVSASFRARGNHTLS